MGKELVWRVWMSGLAQVGRVMVFALLALLSGAAAAQNAELPLQQYGFGKIWTMALSQDGSRLMSGGGDGAAHLWDVATGQLLRSFSVPLGNHYAFTSPVREISLSASGARVLAHSYDNTATWDAATGKNLCLNTAGLLSPDGTSILNYSQLIEVDTGDPIWTLPPQYSLYGGMQAWSFSFDGKRFVTYGIGDTDAKVAQWDTATGQLLQEFALPQGWSDEAYAVNSLVLSRSGTRILTGHADHLMRQWDAVSGALLGAYGNPAIEIDGVALSDDGTRALASGRSLAAGVQPAAWLWDIATSQTLVTFAHAGETPRAVAFVGNRALVLASTADETIHLWDVEKDQLVKTLTGHTPAVVGAELAKDGSKLLTQGEDGKMRVWETATQSLLWSQAGTGRFTPDSAKILNGAGSAPPARLLAAATGTTLATYGGPAGTSCVLAFSGDGTKMLALGSDLTARVWDFASGQTVGTVPPDPQGRIAWQMSYDGMKVLAIRPDCAARWDVGARTMHLLWSDPGNGVAATALAPDGSLVLLGQGSVDSYMTAVGLWDARTGALLHDYSEELGVGEWFSAPPALAFSADGKMGSLCSGNYAFQFAIRTGRWMKSFMAYADFNTAAFSADGTKIVTGGADGVARIWTAGDLKTGVGGWEKYE